MSERESMMPDPTPESLKAEAKDQQFEEQIQKGDN